MNYNILIIINFILILMTYITIKKKYMYLFIPIITIVCIDSLAYYKINQNIENYKDYENSISINKYESRIIMHKKVYVLRDNTYNIEDKEYIKKGLISEIQSLYFYSKQLPTEYNSEYYYQLCMFFKNNVCANIKNKNKRNEYNIQRNNPWYLKNIFIPQSYEEIVLYNYSFLKDIALEKILKQENKCELLLYGSQNGWKKYENYLKENLKDNDNKCIKSLNGKLFFTTNDKINQLKAEFITFLSTEKNGIDNDFESGLISLDELNKNKENSSYKELLMFLYENKPLSQKNINIIQTHYLLSSSHNEEIVSLLTKDKLKEMLKVYKEDLKEESIFALAGREIFLYEDKKINKFSNL